MPNYRIQYRRDTAENWASVNPILLDGEVGYEITDQEGVLLQKVGDGVMGADGSITGTHWNDLPYVSGPIGPAPDHEWQETSLRFRKPNGLWGDYVNLQGPQGIQGIQGIQGEPGTNIPATKTTLGGIIVGEKLSINSDGCLSVESTLYNSKDIIVESGEFTAPVTDYYDVTCIGGGESGGVSSAGMIVGGGSGDYWNDLVYLEKDQIVPVVIGAGGVITGRFDASTNLGGITSFNGIASNSGGSSRFDTTYLRLHDRANGVWIDEKINGNGFGGRGNSGQWYGAGGGAQYISSGSSTATQFIAYNGYQGCVIIRYNDPEKTINS